MSKELNKFNKAYDYSKGYFKEGICGIHNLLWQIMINKTMESKEVVFHVNVRSEGNEIVIACATGGYQETGVYFRSAIYDNCCEVCDQLNIEVFDIDVDPANRITSKSMRSTKAEQL